MVARDHGAHGAADCRTFLSQRLANGFEEQRTAAGNRRGGPLQTGSITCLQNRERLRFAPKSPRTSARCARD